MGIPGLALPVPSSPYILVVTYVVSTLSHDTLLGILIHFSSSIIDMQYVVFHMNS